MTRRLPHFANLRNGGNVYRPRWTLTETVICVLAAAALWTAAYHLEAIWTEANAARLERENTDD